MTDIGGGIFSLVRDGDLSSPISGSREKNWHFDKIEDRPKTLQPKINHPTSHSAEAAALLEFGAHDAFALNPKPGGRGPRNKP